MKAIETKLDISGSRSKDMDQKKIQKPQEGSMYDFKLINSLK